MITVPLNSILTSEEATEQLQKEIIKFMSKHKAGSFSEVSERYRVAQNWDLIIECNYDGHILEFYVPENDWIPAANS